MALYNPENFIEDMQSHPRLQLSKEKSIKLCDQILKIEISGSMSWEEFNKELHTTLEGYLAKEKSDYKIPELKSDIGLVKVPDIAEINSYEGIISYLDVIKGNKIEENLKRFFLRSQLNDEEHNHFVQLFKKYSDMKKQHQKDFLCLYSELLLTQTLTRKMLDWIISIFSKMCKGNINANIRTSLSDGKDDFYIKLNDRISFLRLVFAITIVSPGDEKQEAIDHSKNILLSVFGRDDYNPKSFVEMCYYYAIVNRLSIQALEELLRNTAVNVVVNLFSDSISELKKENVEEYIAEKSLSLIEGFLDFRKYSIKFCIPLIKELNCELSYDDAIKIIENKLRKMRVYHFAIMNAISHQELRETALNVFHKMFSDNISNLKKKDIEKYIKKKSISSIESFLELNSNSIGFCVSLIKELNPELSDNDIIKMVENELKNNRHKFFIGDVSNRSTSTYEYYQAEIEPKLGKSSGKNGQIEFSEWMAGHRRFYEGYYGIGSKTRSEAIYGRVEVKPSDTPAYYAYKIVHKDILHKEFSGYDGVDKLFWRKIEKIQESKNKLEEIYKKLDEVFEEISDYNGEEANIQRVKIYKNVDQMLLAKAILSEVSRSLEEKYAIEIIHLDSLSELNIKELKSIDNICWQKRILSSCKDDKRRFLVLDQMFNRVFTKISPSKEQKIPEQEEKLNKYKAIKARKYTKLNVNRKNLIYAISAELTAYPYNETESNKIEFYAREIVYKHTLSNLKLPGYSGMGTKHWKNKIRDIKGRDERIQEIKKLLKEEFSKINRYIRYQSDLSELSVILNCMNTDFDSLANCINDELCRKSTANTNNSVTRAEYLLSKFRVFAESKESASEFELELSYDKEEKNSEMRQMRWAEFNAMRYQDAMLYMCLNCDDPNEMFERINSTPGYSYYDN